MVDDKFIDDFIADAEKQSAGKNIYIIEGKRELAKYVSNRNIKFVDSLEIFLDILKKNILLSDKIFIHYLHYRLNEFILSLTADIKIGLFFWGGEIVEQPKEVYRKENYEPLTLDYFEKNMQPKPRYIKVANNPFNALRNLKKKQRYKQQLNQEIKTKHKILSRLNYFLHWNQFDYDRIKKRVPKFNPAFKYHFYGIGLDSDLPVTKPKLQDSLVFWIGNSATISNNHLDALKVLEKFKKEDIKIICPLSYGDYNETKYSQFVKKSGEQLFGSKFIAITQFIPRTEYYHLFSEVDVVVMYHNRTQAAGNTAAFIEMGKKLFMQKKSTVYQLLKKNKATVFLNEQLLKMNSKDLKAPLPDQKILNNKNALQRILDTTRKMETLKTLLN